jgi:hypothetical protein
VDSEGLSIAEIVELNLVLDKFLRQGSMYKGGTVAKRHEGTMKQDDFLKGEEAMELPK